MHDCWLATAAAILAVARAGPGVSASDRQHARECAAIVQPATIRGDYGIQIQGTRHRRDG